MTMSDISKEMLRLTPSPFQNDPFTLVWIAFKNIYPDKECEIFYDMHQGDEHDTEYGYAHFPKDGSTPSVYIFAEHPINIQTETLGHELAHIAVGPEHEHDSVWEDAFNRIFNEYNRVGDIIFGERTE